jgi:hypothetical protein
VSRESSVRWAVGTGIATLALVVGIFQWLYPGGPDHKGGAASPSPSTSTAKTGLLRTPMIGYEFWQDDQQAPMNLGPETDGYVVHVSLKREPIEIRLPAPPSKEAVRIAVWTDDSIFNLEQGTRYAEHYLFGLGHGMANGEYFDGNLFPSNEGMNYFVGNRLTPIANGQDQIFVSAFGDTQVAALNTPMYLTIFIDNDHNGRFDIPEYEYIVLTFT